MSWKLTLATFTGLTALAIVAKIVDPEGGTAMWDLTRSSAFMTYLLLWGAVFTGTGVNTRFHPGLERQMAVLELHRILATLGLSFVGMHVLTLILDPVVGFDLWDGFIPLTSDYRPLQVAAGVASMWMLAGVVVSTWAAGYYPRKTWRLVHYAAYPAYALALIHGLTAGSDTVHWPTHVVYSATAGVLLGALFVRFVAKTWIAEAQERAAVSN
jgi:methionine sulfoxide reductase heme-binding subunit